VAVAVVAACAVVVLSGAGVDTGIGGPDPADGGEAVVLILRSVMDVTLPEARVTGADPA
jgi:hypothetical protein